MKPTAHAHYQAHLLTLIGISRFGLRTTPRMPAQAQQLTDSYDRLQRLDVASQSASPTPNLIQSPAASTSKQEPNHLAHQMADPMTSPMSKPAHNVATDPSPLITPSASGSVAPIDVHSDRFGLLAMTYRHLVIIADKAHTDTLTLGIWQALSDKLASVAAQSDHPVSSTTQPGVSYQLSYPLLTPPNVISKAHAQSSTMAQMAMTGFLFPLIDLADRYAKQHTRSVQFVALTQLSAGLVLQAPSLTAPSLADMAHHRQAKLDLWQLLHA